MKLFKIFFLIFLLSSCSEDSDVTAAVIGSSTANNQEAIKESEKNESIIEIRLEIERIDGRLNFFEKS
jgi:hypothetical protein